LIGLFAAFGIVGSVGEAELRAFEAAAAQEIASHLQVRAETVVRVQVLPAGLAETVRGAVRHVEIAAARFSVNGLPLFTESDGPKSGRIGSLAIRLEDFVLRGLPVERLTAELGPCRYDFALARRSRTLRLTESGEGPGYVRVNERGLERFILHKYRGIERVRVRLDGGRILVSGAGEFGLFRSEFLVLARIVPRNGTQLFLEDARVVLNGFRADAATTRGFLAAINPVIDENEDLGLRSAMTIERVRVENGFVELFGTARVPSR
jgi:hypothetical protein